MPRHKKVVETLEESVEEETFDTNEVLEPTPEQDKKFEEIVMEVKPSTVPEPDWESLNYTLTFDEYHKLRKQYGKE